MPLVRTENERPLPNFIDWLVTLCEFVSTFAISSSFFELTTNSDDGDPQSSNSSDSNPQSSIITEWFLREYPELRAGSIVAASILVTIVPILVYHCIGWQWSFLRHPRFPATIQVLKLGGAATNVWYLMTRRDDGMNTFKLLEDRSRLISSGIIAFSEAVAIINTLLVGCCGMSIKHKTPKGRDNPMPRESKFFIFFNLWKDFGIVSSFVKSDELLLLALEFPWPLLLCIVMDHKELGSQQVRYHLLRVVMVGWGFATLYLSARMYKSDMVFVGEKMVPLVLVGCEVVLALCEIWNGRMNIRNERLRTM